MVWSFQNKLSSFEQRYVHIMALIQTTSILYSIIIWVSLLNSVHQKIPKTKILDEVMKIHVLATGYIEYDQI